MSSCKTCKQVGGLASIRLALRTARLRQTVYRYTLKAVRGSTQHYNSSGSLPAAAAVHRPPSQHAATLAPGQVHTVAFHYISGLREGPSNLLKGKMRMY